MDHRSPLLAVVITFDRFPLAGLGCYGNEWIDTEGFDSLAAEGFVFDYAVANEVDVDESSSGFQRRFDHRFDGLESLPQAGGRLIVVSEAEAAGRAHVPAWCEHVLLPECPVVPESAQLMPFAGLIAAGGIKLGELAQIEKPGVLWLQSAGLPNPAIPPTTSFDLYAEEFEETDPDWIDLPEEQLVQHPAVKAAYLTLMDHWLQQLIQALRALTRPVQFHVLGFSGDEWLPSPARNSEVESLSGMKARIPWIVWSNEAASMAFPWPPGRSAAIVQPSDLTETLTASLGQPASSAGVLPLLENSQRAWRDKAVTRGPRNSIIVWSNSDMVIWDQRNEPQSSKVLLESGVRRYLLPEDPWNAFDVAAASPDQIAAVEAWLQRHHEM